MVRTYDQTYIQLIITICVNNNSVFAQLREMAARQQQQIEAQQQQLVAKEQRLKYLKQQEYQHHQMASEYDRLRRWDNST